MGLRPRARFVRAWSSAITTYSMFFGWEGPERGWGGGGRLFEIEFEREGGEVGVEVVNFSALRMGAYSR